MNEMKKQLYEVSVVVEASDGVPEQEIEDLAEVLLDLVQSRYAALALGAAVSFNSLKSRIEVMFNVAADAPADAQNRAGLISEGILHRANRFHFQSATTEAVDDDCVELVSA